jgi:uncharacterized membrane protein YtjA (UPF0391 family)
MIGCYCQGINESRLLDLKGEKIMLSWALTFVVVALIAGLLGFFALAGLAATIAKILFLVFLVAFVVSLITGRRASV